MQESVIVVDDESFHEKRTMTIRIRTSRGCFSIYCSSKKQTKEETKKKQQATLIYNTVGSNINHKS